MASPPRDQDSSSPPRAHLDSPYNDGPRNEYRVRPSPQVGLAVSSSSAAHQASMYQSGYPRRHSSSADTVDTTDDPEGPTNGRAATMPLSSQASTANLAPRRAQTTALPVRPSTQLLSPPDDGELKPAKHRSLWHVIKDWNLELLAAVLAVATLITEIILLLHYNNKFLIQHWSHTWKINSVFAFLTTFMEAAIMFFVAACIGQLRWHWFKKQQHRLDWLEIMTGASRPSGAVRLLIRKGMHRQFAAFGALIVILLLGVSTFTQQVITEVIRPFPLGFGLGTIPISTNYTWFDRDLENRLGTQQPLPGMVAAIENGVYSFSSTNILQSIAALSTCYGESCKFGRYQSLAVCSQCDDISEEVFNPCPSGNCTDSDYYTLSNDADLSLLATHGVMNLTADTSYPTSQPLSSAVGPLIVRLHALVMNETLANKTGLGASALQCAAWWCVKTYNTTIKNGIVHERTTDVYTDKSPAAKTYYGQGNEIELKPPSCYVNDTTPSNSSYCSYGAGAFTQVALQNFLAAPDPSLPFPAFLSGSCIAHGYGGRTLWNYTSLLAGGLTSASTAKKDILDRVKVGFQNMADQMTVSIRGEVTNDYNFEFTYGRAFMREQKFHVRWAWLAYPVAIVFASLLFFVTTIIMTRKDEVWKSSVLPMIFHSFGGADHDELVKVDTVEDMKKVSRSRKVFLGGDHGHAALKAGKRVRTYGHGHMYEMTQEAAGGLGWMGEVASVAQ